MPNDIQYSLGALPNPPDERDFLLANYMPLKVERPAELIFPMSPVKYQAGLGACVAFGFGSVVEHFNNVEFSKVLDLSEQHLYGEAKKIDDYPGEGTYPRAAAEALLKVGVCEERFFPYEGKYPPSSKPLPGYADNALTYRIKNYAAVSTDFESVKDALFFSGPLTVSILVYDNFMTGMGNDGVVPMPSGSRKGGHMMCVAGYLNTPGQPILVKNSWSTRWGKDGYCIFHKAAWDKLVKGVVAVVDLSNIALPWLDWPTSEIETGFKVKNSGIMEGYPPKPGQTLGSFFPYVTLKKRHVYLIAKRMGITLDKVLEDDYTDATRLWVDSQIPNLPWNSEVTPEPITRVQMALLVGRLLSG